MMIRGYQLFFAELKRRSVFRVMAVYGATAFVVIEEADMIFPAIHLPPWTVSLVVWLALHGPSRRDEPSVGGQAFLVTTDDEVIRGCR